MNDVARLSNQNYLESIRAHAAFQNPCDCREQDGILLVAGASGFPGGYWNAAARTQPGISPEVLFEAARAFFHDKKRGYSISVIAKQDPDLEQLLRAREFESRFEIPCMAVTQPLPVPKAADGIRVETISTQKHVEDFIEVSVLSYALLGLPEVHARAMFTNPHALLGKNILGVIAYRGAEPLAAGFALMSEDCGGLYWIGTRPNGQRMGLGALMTVLTTNMAFDAGAKVVTLQASQFGEPVYRQLGFESYDVLRRYAPPMPD